MRAPRETLHSGAYGLRFSGIVPDRLLLSRAQLTCLHEQTFLHNRTGGLQVLPPGANQWYYVKERAASFSAMPYNGRIVEVY